MSKLNVSHGQSIQKGDVIAVLDTYARRQSAWETAQEELKVARSKLEQVKAGAKRGEIQAQKATISRLQVERVTQIAAQKANLARVIAETETQIAAQKANLARVIAVLNNAELENERYEVLYQQEVVTASIRDSKRLTLQTAQQKVNQAKANLDRIDTSGRQQINEARANLERIDTSGRQQINEARANLRKIETSMEQQIKEGQFTQ